MTQKHEIEILIGPDGEIKLDVKGMKGPTCLTAVKKLADEVGTLTSTDLKPEYYEKPQTEQKRKQGA